MPPGLTSIERCIAPAWSSARVVHKPRCTARSSLIPNRPPGRNSSVLHSASKPYSKSTARSATRQTITLRQRWYSSHPRREVLVLDRHRVLHQREPREVRVEEARIQRRVTAIGPHLEHACGVAPPLSAPTPRTPGPATAAPSSAPTAAPATSTPRSAVRKPACRPRSRSSPRSWSLRSSCLAQRSAGTAPLREISSGKMAEGAALSATENAELARVRGAVSMLRGR